MEKLNKIMLIQDFKNYESLVQRKLMKLVECSANQNETLINLMLTNECDEFDA